MSKFHPLTTSFVTAITLLLTVASTEAQVNKLPAQYDGVQIIERTGDTIPLDLPFTDEDGNTVTLSHYINGTRPVILMLVYYQCPMLCNLIMNGVVEGIKPLDWMPGEQFEIVTVSIDARETPATAREKKKNYLTSLGKPGAAKGWHFLTGEQPHLVRLADAVGYGFRFIPETNDFAHKSAIFILTPSGTISRYLHGIEYQPRTLQLSLLDASEGKIRPTLFEQVQFYCYQYDPSTGSYTLQAMRVMQLGSLAAALMLIGALTFFWIRESRRHHPPEAGSAAQSTPASELPPSTTPNPAPDGTADGAVS